MLTPEFVPVLVKTGSSARVDVEVAPRFKVGDKIVARNINPVTHTRLPRYIRGKRGVINMDHGVFVFPDAAVQGSEKPQHVYSVRFEARELWGDTAVSKDCVYIDVWDDYMDPQ